MNAPLAERLRPKKLADYISQSHLIGSNGALTQALKQGLIPSMIFWGPPGIGKTTLATIIATESERPFYTLSAISSGVKDVREVIEKAKTGGGLFTTKNPILFIDEIHRFSKSQQDSLLQAVEKGWVTLIGATTENPSFEVISALLSRCQVYTLKPFDTSDLEVLLKRAIETDELLSKKKIKLLETEALLRLSGGDARKLLNIFELIVNSDSATNVTITNQLVLDKVQNSTVLYDKTGDQHYDIISAFIKSIRGSDPNGAVYWLARMLEGGEDVKFIARRMLIFDARPPQNAGNAYPPSGLRKSPLCRIAIIFRHPTAIDENGAPIVKLEWRNDMKTGIAFIGSAGQEHFLIMLECAIKRQTTKFDIIKASICCRNSNCRRRRTRLKTGDQIIFPLQTLQLP